MAVISMAARGFLAALLVAWTGAGDLRAQSATEAAEPFATGAPANPSPAWALSAGGRLYDNWWLATGKDAPTIRNPAYPAAGKAKDADTWRCKECHGWDYRGRDGVYREGSHFTGIVGIRAMQGRPVADIVKILRDANHPNPPGGLSQADVERLAQFVATGQHDVTTALRGQPAKAVGDSARGQAIFQTTCAACHGFDGKLLNWGSDKEPEYIGTAANAFPEEFMHKTRNGHPGAVMINLRAFPLQDTIDVLAYAQTLPEK